MIERDGFAARFIDLRVDRIAGTQLAAFEHADVGERSADFLGITYREARISGKQHAAIADLTAALRVKRRVVENDLTLLTRPERIDERTVKYQRGDVGCVRQPIIARKVRLSREFDGIPQIYAEFACRLRAAALPLHCDIEARLVDRKAALARYIRRKIRGKAVSIVESKNCVARNHRGLELRDLSIQEGHAGRECLGESTLFLSQHLGGARGACNQLRVVRAHFL